LAISTWIRTIFGERLEEVCVMHGVPNCEDCTRFQIARDALLESLKVHGGDGDTEKDGWAPTTKETAE
jgi:hypothetical protein